MLFARLEVTVPQARSFLVAAPRSTIDVTDIAADLAYVAGRAGFESRLVDLTGHQRTADASTASVPATVDDQVEGELVELDEPASSEMGRVERLRQLLAAYEGYTVMAGGGVLDDPGTMLAAAAVDGVVLVVRRGRTSRTDLEQSRIEIERAGGRIVGAVLRD